jgi:hypothetical protein
LFWGPWWAQMAQLILYDHKACRHTGKVEDAHLSTCCDGFLDLHKKTTFYKCPLFVMKFIKWKIGTNWNALM